VDSKVRVVPIFSLRGRAALSSGSTSGNSKCEPVPPSGVKPKPSRILKESAWRCASCLTTGEKPVKFTFYFHASREEIAALAGGWSTELGASLVAERFFPGYEACLLDANEVGRVIREDATVNRISLVPAKVELNVASALNFAKKNPGSLFILLGKQDDLRLQETVVSGMSDDPAVVRKWKNIRDRARRSMIKISRVENTVTGASAEVTGHYCTHEVKRLADSGLLLVRGTEWIRYTL
jgi:hypothetical protein